MVEMMDGMKTQLKEVEDTALCVVGNLPDTAAEFIENDVVDLKNKFEKYVVVI